MSKKKITKREVRDGKVYDVPYTEGVAEEVASLTLAREGVLEIITTHIAKDTDGVTDDILAFLVDGKYLA